jgi:hypothetical protein
MILSPRRRNVLCLRAAGFSQEQIAATLGITEGLVRKDVVAISKLLIPGVTDGLPGEAKAYRLVYVLGLLDAGVPAEEVGDYMRALVDRVMMRQAQETAEA